MYEIYKVRGGYDAPADYLLMKDGRRLPDGWIPHDQLIRVGEEERPPDETLLPRDYKQYIAALLISLPVGPGRQ